MRGWSARLLVASMLAVVALPAAAQGRERAFSGAPESFRAWAEQLPPEERRPLVRRLQRMPEERRERLFRRWDRAALAERERFKRFFRERSARRVERDPGLRPERRPPGRRGPMRRFEQLPPESRERLAPLAERWRGMEPGERRRMRRRLERFRMLSDAEQEALIDERYGSRAPAERARILESLRSASRALSDRAAPPVPAPDPTASEPSTP